MNILVVDSQGILNEKQKVSARDRLYYSLARFEYRINGVTMHFSVDENCERVKCAINVNVEGSGIVSVIRSCVSSEDAMNLAAAAIESRVACRVDWHAWFNADTMATWFLSISQRLEFLFGFNRESHVSKGPSSSTFYSNQNPVRQPKMNKKPPFRFRTKTANTISN